MYLVFYFKVLSFLSLWRQSEILSLATVSTVGEQAHRSEAPGLLKLPTYYRWQLHHLETGNKDFCCCCCCCQNSVLLAQSVREQSHTEWLVELYRNFWELALGRKRLAGNLHWKPTLLGSMWLSPDLIFFSPKGSKASGKVLAWVAGSFTLQSKLRINSKTNHQREFLSLTLSVTGMVFKFKK